MLTENTEFSYFMDVSFAVGIILQAREQILLMSSRMPPGYTKAQSKLR